MPAASSGAGFPREATSSETRQLDALPDQFRIQQLLGATQSRRPSLTAQRHGFSPPFTVKYMPNGKVAEMDNPKRKMRIAGKAKGCIECHDGADGEDFAFFNDSLTLK